MFIAIDRALLEAYSRGEMTRHEIQDRMNEAVSFGNLLAQLHAHNLPLPRLPSDPNAPGTRLIRRLAERGHRVG